MLRKLLALATVIVLPALAVAAEVATSTPASAPFPGPAAVQPPSLVPAARVTPSLRLVWLDPARVAFGTEAVAQPEVEHLLAKMGVAVTWRRGDSNEVARSGELRVIFLNRGTEREHGVPVLGATPARFEGQPFVWVHVPSVRAAAGIGHSGPGLELSEVRQLGLALGRVIAHELVHAVAPAVPHGSGLMSARLDRRMLTASRIGLDPQVGDVVCAALRGEAPAVPAHQPILAAEGGYKEPFR